MPQKSIEATLASYFDGIAELKEALAQIEPLSYAMYRHAVGVIAGDVLRHSAKRLAASPDD